MINREAILHIPMSEYAHGRDETHYLFRIRAARGNIKECNFYYGDTACRQTPILFHRESMRVEASDELFDYFTVEMEGLYHRIYYYFELINEEEKQYYYADFFREELVPDRSEYYKLPFNRREDIADIPGWAKQAVIYNIFPDSFATKYRYLSGKTAEKNYSGHIVKSRLGGTIRGIEENADYLEGLGINCIYINPVFAAGEYHKYDTLDYKTVDPCFGTNEEFGQMVRTMHEHGIRVIIDGVFNHCGWQFPAFEDVVEKGQKSPYKDWFYRLKFPVIRPENPEDTPDYECFAYERMMPKLNTSNEEVKARLLEAAVYWIREYDIDGWRLDVASEVDDGFWRDFRKAVKAVKPDSFLIGEVWETARHWLDGSQFDSTMNYDMRKHCTDFFAKGKLDAAAFDGRVCNMRMRYRKNLLYGQLNLLDSHDVSRFYSVCGEDTARFKLSVLFQMFFVGIPSVFYGDEQQIAGTGEEDYRQGMRWDTNHPIFLFYRKAIAFRKSTAAFWKGEYSTLTAEKGSMLYGFARRYQKEEWHIYLNAGGETEELPAETGRPVWSENWTLGKLFGFGFAIFSSFSYNETDRTTN